jgi:hypothetical protein
LFDEQAHTETEHERESDHDNQVSEFFGAFYPGFVEKETGRLKVFEQGFDLEAALEVLAALVAQIQIQQQEKRLCMSFSTPIHGVCQR